MKKVVIYTKHGCSYCKKAVDLLSSKNIDLKEINVTYDLTRFDEIVAKTNCNTVPQIFIDGEFIGGCDDVFDLDKKGLLDEKLGLI